MYNYAKLPEELQAGMQRYVEEGIPTGHFLGAVLSNDLYGAVSRADSTNIKLIPEIVRWIYNEVPIGCWGSVSRVREWRGEKHLIPIIRSSNGIVHKEEDSYD